jgi:hypothetical protein
LEDFFGEGFTAFLAALVGLGIAAFFALAIGSLHALSDAIVGQAYGWLIERCPGG